MKFQFSEKKVRLPENVHAYAEKKVKKRDRYFNGDAEALVAFSVEKNRKKVELTVHAANTWFRASESTSDMFASIDAAVGTIEGQIRKNKTRLARRLRQGRVPFCHVFAGNRASLALQKKLGLSLRRDMYWLGGE